MKKINIFIKICILALIAITGIQQKIVHADTIEKTERANVLVDQPKLVNHPLAQNNGMIDFPHSFIPVTGEENGVTFEPFGDVYRTGIYYYLKPQETHANDPVAKVKGGVIAHNVGTYKGQSLDLKIELINYDLYSYNGTSRPPKIGIDTTSYGALVSNMKANMQYTYFKAGTQEPIEVAGFFNFSDIDFFESVTFEGAAIQYVYPTAQNNLSYKDTSGGGIEVMSTSGVNIPAANDPEKNRVSYINL